MNTQEQKIEMLEMCEAVERYKEYIEDLNGAEKMMFIGVLNFEEFLEDWGLEVEDDMGCIVVWVAGDKNEYGYWTHLGRVDKDWFNGAEIAKIPKELAYDEDIQAIRQYLNQR